jgi:ADP-heptose:LPS heptosyltransferase
VKHFENRPVGVGEEVGSETPRVLIVRAGAIGDTLMVTPLLRAVRRTFPRACLAFLCSQRAFDVLRHNPHLNAIIPLAYRHLPAWLSKEKRRTARQLRDLKLDWAVVLESHPGLLDFARRARAARLIAYGVLPQIDGFERAQFDPHKHSIENHLRAAQPLDVQPAGLEMELYYPSRLDEVVRQRLTRVGIQENDLVVGVHPGWGGRRHSLHQTRLRSWPADRFAAVIRWLVERAGSRVVLTGSSGDRRLTGLIASRSAVRCLNLAGELSLLEMAALIRRLNCYLTVDSGPAHMAAALGTPLVTLWGPGIFEQTSPSAGRGPVTIINHRVHCSPCYGTPLMKSCQDNICMKQIEVGEVQEAIERMLTSPKAGRSGNYSGSIRASSTSMTGISSLIG